MLPVWTTPAGFLLTATELVTTSTTISASGALSYKFISGKFPLGLSLSSSTGIISGTPDEVLTTSTFKFCVRASNTSGIADRTFVIDISGAGEPIWNTYQLTTSTTTGTLITTLGDGYLDLDNSGHPYIFNNRSVSLQLSANIPGAPPGTTIKYFIGDKDGRLPPGLKLSQSGEISGIIKDKLNFDAEGAPEGGYDDEAYDNYSYDHAVSNSVVPITTAPKVYQFKVTATDGINRSKKLFKIIVVNPNMFRADSSLLPMGSNILNLFYIKSDVGYLQKPQFIKGTNLGIVRASNEVTLDISAYDPDVTTGPINYSLITGTNILTYLPQGLNISTSKGYIYGFVPYQPAYTKNYSLTIAATKTNPITGKSVTATNTFTLAIQGEVESSIEWITTSTLGTIETGIVSELAIQAQQIKSDYPIKYQILNGSLPPGLELKNDGGLAGRVTYGTTGTFTFTVQASDVYELSAIERSFSLSVTDSGKKYTDVYFRPFLPLEIRKQYQEFISNEFTFDPKLIYRYFDPNFGVQHNIKMILEFGLEQVNLSEYTVALRENFYRKKLYFGDVKLAYVIKNKEIMYEVVYVDIIDDMMINNNISADPVIYTNNQIYYPGSIENMRKQLKSIVLEDNSYIEIDEMHRPSFMRSLQLDNYRPLGYIKVVPICYALPGQGQKIISRIRLSGFDFKIINFEIDRLIVQNSLDNSTAKYLIFDRQSIGDLIETDSYLYGLDYDVLLETENNSPIIRE